MSEPKKRLRGVKFFLDLGSKVWDNLSSEPGVNHHVRSDIMLGFQSSSVNNRTPVSRISLSSGKCGLPYVSSNRVAYPQGFTSLGQVSKFTVVTKCSKNSWTLSVFELKLEGMVEVYTLHTNLQGAVNHIFQDLQKGHHRLYSAESCAIRTSVGREATRDMAGNLLNNGIAGTMQFHDGVAALLSALEHISGANLNSGYSPVCPYKTGVKSSCPTVEKVVFGQARRHNKVRRPSGSKSFSSGMSSTVSGGAKPPSQKEKAERLQCSAKRALEKMSAYLEKGETRKAQCYFKIAEDFETRARTIQTVLNDRMALLREKAAAARKHREEVKRIAQSCMSELQTEAQAERDIEKEERKEKENAA